MDISTAGNVSAREDQGVVVAIKDVNGEPELEQGQPVTITIAGSYSSRYRRTQEAQTQRILKRRNAQMTTEQLAANRTELVAACVLAWTGIMNKGEPLPCTKENATKVLNAAPWVRDQLEDAQADHAGFSSADSAS